MNPIWLIRFITFLSAFLLFQIELIIGKIFLPNFGGSYLVWGACIVFFQAALLLGYLYAHCVVQWLGIERYRKFHLGFILLPLLFFPGHSLALRYPSSNLPMVIEVFWKLLLTIGPAFFVLSTISIIWQAWLAESHLPERKNPYTLFAVSNLGSFAALLTYPFVFEMVWDLHIQQKIWRISYLIFIALHFAAFKWIRVQPKETSSHNLNTTINKTILWQWLLYSAAGVFIFLSVTNVITSEIAPMPLFWMLPLAIYLLTFVLNFKKNPWCPRWIVNQIPVIMTLGIVFYFVMLQRIIPVPISACILLLLTFMLCMFCQNRLHTTRPVDHQKLTFFYFISSLGSFVGGITATWLVPLISSSYLEYFLGFFLISLAWQIEDMKKWKIRGAVTASILMIILLLPILESTFSKEKYIFSHRNYYGITKVIEQPKVRFLLHGSTIHGGQFLEEQRSFIPLVYYNPKSPTAEILIRDKSLKKIGIIGLGTGALAVYPEKDQHMDFFELDPDVHAITKKYFTFLNKSRASVKHFYGDARLSLEKMDKQNYNLLVVDAFSGDSVPVHLLTTEALSTYRQQILPDGIIVFHVTNRYLDLRYPLLKTAMESGAFVAYKKDIDYISGIFRSDWIAITWDKNQFVKLLTEGKWQTISEKDIVKFRPWTDSYSTLLPCFKFPRQKK